MKFLVALDGSESSFAALRTALRLARRAGAYVTAVYVNKAEAYSPEETGWGSVAAKLARELEARGEQVLREARELGRTHGMGVDCLLAAGNPCEQITDYAAAHGIVKLVAVGHSSKGRGAQGFVESTTKSVILQAGVPVLATSVEREVGRVLVAVEEAAAAERSARVAALLARGGDLAVTLVSVVPDAELLLREYGRLAESRGIGAHAEELEATFRRRSSLALAAAAEVLRSCGASPQVLTLEGEPAQELLAEARRHDLTVVGVRRGALRTRSLGPVAHAFLEEHRLTSLFVQ